MTPLRDSSCQVSSVSALVSKLTDVKDLIFTSVDTLEEDVYNAPIHSPEQRHLLILVAASVSHLCISVPEHFTELGVLSCSTGDLHILPQSTYCGISLYAWRARNTHLTWNFQMNDGVDFVVPPDTAELEMAPVDLKKRDSIKLVLKLVMQQVKQALKENPNAPLPWSVGGAGLSTRAVHKFIKIRHDGILIPASVANGIVAGGAVAARGLTLFFVPFQTIAGWMAYAWPHFIKLIKAVWAFFNDKKKLQTFLESCFLALSAYQHARTLMSR